MAARRKSSSRRPGAAVGAAPRAKAGPDVERARIADVRRRLAKAIPAPRCELDHADAWQLLVATILSAQSTDRTVNSVTPALFRRWPTPAALADAPRAEVEEAVHRTGFFRNKAKAIQAASRELVDEHGGEVPRSLDALVELPGVARKTANVVLGTAFGLATGVVVDTHVARVARRLGLTAETDPVKIERDLQALLPQREWVAGGHRLLLHGRYVCTAKRPRCAACPLNEVCAAREAEPEGSLAARAKAESELVAARGET